MAQQASAQRIGAYAWCLILTVAGGAMIIGALGGSPGEEPATLIAEKDTPLPVIAAEPEGALDSVGERMGVTHVSKTE